MKISTSGIASKDRGVVYETQFDWQNVSLIQGGSAGVVINTKDGTSYRTAFIEVFGDDMGFVRGEGKDIAAAESDAWAKSQRIITCPEHEYEPRGYKNGAGFCKNCNRFKRQMFTASELHLFCRECGNATFIRDSHGSICDEHHPGRELAARLEEISNGAPEAYEEEWFDLHAEYLKY